jgi:hypothetical protein
MALTGMQRSYATCRLQLITWEWHAADCLHVLDVVAQENRYRVKNPDLTVEPSTRYT